ncbi:prepilin-type N-terminal cleavage/methylation domain-containing protein [Frondihabitans cladoniiphilus]|uniref:Prepilin-type N-terminal cleavage/methylation domain-containing protein n=1 Tax=Frondihabitans cladoniiphilus TaxID=715785 RepID=A0ABP8VZ03_9MICO
MNRIRLVLGLDTSTSGRRRTSDQGLTLVEVMVAMLVFTIISVAVAMSLGNSLVISKNSRARTVAVNLASQDLDLQRAVADVFAVQTKTWVTPVQGTNYTINRQVNWVSSSTATSACGTGTGTLQFKTVRDTVTWPGNATGVATSTVLAPNGRINDPTLGTIVVAVTGASGAGVSGVTATITPTSGGAAVTTPALTDANGCTYALKVTPGTYTIAISRAGSLDIKQNATVSTSRAVTAGTATSVSFTYDAAAPFTLKYASNYTSGPTAQLPNNLDVTVTSTTAGQYSFKPGTTNPVSLFPFTSPYVIETGAYVPAGTTTSTGADASCLNVDPGQWTTANAAKAVGTSFTAGSTPGTAKTVNVPMGVVNLSALTGTLGITATSVNTKPAGDPGCAATTTYTFNAVSGSPTLALPFGTWRLAAVASILTLNATSIPTGGTINSDGTVTLDPRGVTQ